jgi:hypothetical protein
VLLGLLPEPNDPPAVLRALKRRAARHVPQADPAGSVQKAPPPQLVQLSTGAVHDEPLPQTHWWPALQWSALPTRQSPTELQPHTPFKHAVPSELPEQPMLQPPQ